ncbi:MAG: hypothetical protein H5T69_10985 [Chloroflexi bacterium]|nr:hypothetical protein [Chloroflexota bacterium]
MSAYDRHTGEADAPSEIMLRRPLFPGLVYNEAGERAEVAMIGGVAHYAIPDQGFMRHVEAYRVDRAVIARLQEQIGAVQDELVRGMMQMLGKNDLFTKAALDASIRNLEQSFYGGDPEQWVPWLRLFGFRVIVDIHGNVVDVLYPEAPIDEDE